MQGLLARAQTWLSDERAVRGQESSVSEEDSPDTGVTEDERRELVSQIERLFSERHPIELEAARRRRGGGAFPLVVNLVAAVALAGAILVVTRVIGYQSSQNAGKSASFLTTEGLVVKAVKQRAASELSQREKRIAQIQSELNSLRRSGAPTGASSNARERQLESELSSLRSNVGLRLSDLQAQRAQEVFQLRQLQSIYQNMRSNIEANQINSALSNLDAAQRMLSSAASTSNSPLSTVAPALSAGNDVLRTTLLFAQSEAAAAHSTALPAQIAAIDGFVKRGDQRYQAGDLAGARSSYLRALAYLSSISRAYNRLAAMQKDSFDGQRSKLDGRIHALETQVATLNATIQAKDRTIADERNRRAAAETRIGEQQRTIEADKLAVAKRSSELATVVNSTFQAIHSASKSAGQAKAGNSVVDLLKTKVEIRGLADTPQAKSSYPDLYRHLDSFFQGYAETYRTQGRTEALDQVASALNNVIVALNLHLPVSTPNATSGKGESEQKPRLSFADPVPSYLDAVDQTLGRMAGSAN